MTNFATSFLILKYHALFVNFIKSSKIGNCCLLQIVGGALYVDLEILTLVCTIIESNWDFFFYISDHHSLHQTV